MSRNSQSVLNSLVISNSIIKLSSVLLKKGMDLWLISNEVNASLFARINAITFIPVLIFALIGGRIGDNLDRSKVVRIVHIIYIFVYLSGIILAIFNKNHIIYIVILALLIDASLSNIFITSLRGLIPVQLKGDEVGICNARISMFSEVSKVIAPILAAAIVYSTNNIVVILILILALYGFSAVNFKKNVDFGEVYNFKNEAKISFKMAINYFVTEKTLMLSYVLLGLSNFFIAFYDISVPLICRDIFNNTKLYGISVIIISICSIVGAFFSNRIFRVTEINTLEKLLFISVLPLLFLDYVHNEFLFIIIVGLQALVQAIINVKIYIMVQEKSEVSFLSSMLSYLIISTILPVIISNIIFSNLVFRYLSSIGTIVFLGVIVVLFVERILRKSIMFY